MSNCWSKRVQCPLTVYWRAVTPRSFWLLTDVQWSRLMRPTNLNRQVLMCDTMVKIESSRMVSGAWKHRHPASKIRLAVQSELSTLGGGIHGPEGANRSAGMYLGRRRIPWWRLGWRGPTLEAPWPEELDSRAAQPWSHAKHGSGQDSPQQQPGDRHGGKRATSCPNTTKWMWALSAPTS